MIRFSRSRRPGRLTAATALLAWLMAGAVALGQPAANPGPVEVPPLGATNAAPRANPTSLRPSMATPMRTPTNAIPAPTPAGAPASTARPPGVRPGFTPVGAPPAPGATVLPVVPGGAPGPAPGGANPAGGGAGGEDEDEDGVGLTAEQAAQIEEGEMVTLQLNNAPLDTVLDIYSGLVRRVLLRPPQLAGGPITLKIAELTREETIEAFNGVLALNGISVVPVGEKFVKVVPSQEVVNQGAKQDDGDPTQFSELGQFVTKLVRVTKIKPGDIAQAVQAFASTKVQNPVLVFDDQNFFILRDMAANVKRMAELIKELDVTPELDYKLEVIPIRYGKVDEIYDTLNSVVTGSGGGGGFASGGTSSRTSGRAGSMRGGAGGIGTGGIGGAGGLNNTFSPQQTSATGRGGMTSPGAARSSLAERLRQVTAMGSGGGGAAGGGQVNLLEGARIIPDMRSNSLLVYASKEEYKMLTNIVAKIDTLLAQVLIESIILEVTLEKGKDFGVSMVQNPRQFGDWATTGGSVNDASVATNLLGSVLPSGFSYFGQYKDQFSLAMTAIANDSNAKVLARPRIQTTHAQPANFAIGDTVPYPRSSSYGGFGGINGGFSPFTTYDEKEVLTMLAVTPYITPDGLVTLEVEQTIDQLGPTVKVGQDEVPTIRKREASAVLSVRDREPVILGGFITDRSTDSNSGVPWLKDLPLLGWAFRSKNSFKQRSELIVLIRPTILNSPEEATRLAGMEQRSLPNAAAAERAFKEAEAKMAERLGVVPGGTNAPVVPEKKSRRTSRSKRGD